MAVPPTDAIRSSDHGPFVRAQTHVHHALDHFTGACGVLEVLAHQNHCSKRRVRHARELDVDDLAGGAALRVQERRDGTLERDRAPAAGTLAAG